MTSKIIKRKGFLSIFSLSLFFFLFNLLSPLKAQQIDTFQQGKNHYEYGDYRKAAQCFEEFLTSAKEIEKEKQCQTLKLLAVCYYILDEKDRSRECFYQLLALDPQQELDPLFFPPEIISLFNHLKKDFLAQKVSLPSPAAEEGEGEVKRRDFYYHLTPFGGGQFYNGQKKKGYLFLTMEGALLSANIFLYWWRKDKENPDGTYSDVEQSKALQNLQLTAGYLLIAVGIYAVIDAFSYRPPPPSVREGGASNRFIWGIEKEGFLIGYQYQF